MFLVRFPVHYFHYFRCGISCQRGTLSVPLVSCLGCFCSLQMSLWKFWISLLWRWYFMEIFIKLSWSFLTLTILFIFQTFLANKGNIPQNPCPLKISSDLHYQFSQCIMFILARLNLLVFFLVYLGWSILML